MERFVDLFSEEKKYILDEVKYVSHFDLDKAVEMTLHLEDSIEFIDAIDTGISIKYTRKLVFDDENGPFDLMVSCRIFNEFSDPPKGNKILHLYQVENELQNNADYFIGAAASKVSLLISEILGVFTPATLVSPPSYLGAVQK